jgi:folylpolyglutamate synthase/dihydropteroate synthase
LLALAESIRATHHWSRPNLYASPNPTSAWQLLVSRAAPQNLICITGSFFLAAETRALAEEYIRSLATTNSWMS